MFSRQVTTLITALVLAFASAAPAAGATPEGNYRDLCEKAEKMGRNIMLARQNGVPMSKLVRLAEETGVDSVIERVIIAAYEQPRFATEEYRKAAVKKFAGNSYLQCIKELR